MITRFAAAPLRPRHVAKLRDGPGDQPAGRPSPSASRCAERPPTIRLAIGRPGPIRCGRSAFARKGFTMKTHTPRGLLRAGRAAGLVAATLMAFAPALAAARCASEGDQV